MKYFISFLLFIFSVVSYAMFCPTNFESINIGDSIDKVKMICGQPNSEQNSQGQSSSEEWHYYVKSSAVSQATLPMIIVMQNNRVINITIDNLISNNGQVCQAFKTGGGDNKIVQTFCQNIDGPKSVANTQACGQIIQVGDSSRTIESACGKPVMIKSLSVPQSEAGITVLKYVGPPRTTLVFENNRLKMRSFS